MKKKLFITPFLFLVLTGYNVNTMAHSGGSVMDSGGTNAHFTAVVDVSCFDDGNGVPDHIFVKIKDTANPVAGLLLNFQVYKGNKAISTTDPISGDNQFSPGVELQGGAGRYTLIINKTAVGSRSFSAEWHCETATGVHTGTDDIIVRQFQ